VCLSRGCELKHDMDQSDLECSLQNLNENPLSGMWSRIRSGPDSSILCAARHEIAWSPIPGTVWKSIALCRGAQRSGSVAGQRTPGQTQRLRDGDKCSPSHPSRPKVLAIRGPASYPCLFVWRFQQGGSWR